MLPALRLKTPKRKVRVRRYSVFIDFSFRAPAGGLAVGTQTPERDGNGSRKRKLRRSTFIQPSAEDNFVPL